MFHVGLISGTVRDAFSREDCRFSLFVVPSPHDAVGNINTQFVYKID